MKKKLKISLYRSLILSDFFLLQKKFHKKNAYIAQASLAKQTFQSLDVIKLGSQLKQFVRLLQYLNVSKKSLLIMQVDSAENFSLLKEFIRQYSFFFKIKVQLQTKKYFRKKSTAGIVLLESSVENSRVLMNQLFLKNFFLILKINLKLEINFENFYKLYNNLLDFKKIIFLMILIKKVVEITKSQKRVKKTLCAF